MSHKHPTSTHQNILERIIWATGACSGAYCAFKGIEGFSSRKKATSTRASTLHPDSRLQSISVGACWVLVAHSQAPSPGFWELRRKHLVCVAFWRGSLPTSSADGRAAQATPLHSADASRGSSIGSARATLRHAPCCVEVLRGDIRFSLPQGSFWREVVLGGGIRLGLPERARCREVMFRERPLKKNH